MTPAERHLPATLDWFLEIGGAIRPNGHYPELGKMWFGGQFVWCDGRVLRTRGEVLDVAKILGVKVKEE